MHIWIPYDYAFKIRIPEKAIFYCIKANNARRKCGKKNCYTVNVGGSYLNFFELLGTVEDIMVTEVQG